jgi:hypothetical protein
MDMHVYKHMYIYIYIYIYTGTSAILQPSLSSMNIRDRTDTLWNDVDLRYT